MLTNSWDGGVCPSGLCDDECTVPTELSLIRQDHRELGRSRYAAPLRTAMVPARRLCCGGYTASTGASKNTALVAFTGRNAREGMQRDDHVAPVDVVKCNALATCTRGKTGVANVPA